MAHLNSDAPRQNRFGSVFHAARGLLARQAAVVAQPSRLLGRRKSAADAYVEEKTRYFTDPGNLDRISFIETEVDRSAEIRAKTEAHIRALVAMSDWDGLADTMAELDQTRAACPDGSRLVYVALEVVTDCFATGYYDTSECMPFPVAAIPEFEIDRMEAIATAQPRAYPLAAIASHFRLQNAWEHRGGVYADDVVEDAWAAALGCVDRAADVLEPHVDRHPNSPLVAYLEFCRLPFDPEGDRHVHTLYRDWAELDPDNQLAHREYGYFLLPRWFGEEDEFELYLRKAAVENRGAHGAAAYASAYLHMHKFDRFAVYQMDAILFREGVLALAELSDNDPCVVARLVQDVHDLAQFSIPRRLDEETAVVLGRTQTALIDTRDRLLRAHLTAINPDAWKGGTDDALNHLSLIVQAELATNATFTLDQNGLTVSEDSA